MYRVPSGATAQPPIDPPRSPGTIPPSGDLSLPPSRSGRDQSGPYALFLHGCAHGLRAHYYGHNLKIHQVSPVFHPLVEEVGVFGFHELVAAVKVDFDPAGYVLQAFGHHAALFLETGINGFLIAVLKVLDYHE